MNLGRLALRNLLRRHGRYAPAFATLVFFGLAFTVLWGVGDSISRNLEARALVYYGGQGTVLTFRNDSGRWDDSARDPGSTLSLGSLDWIEGTGLRHVYRQPAELLFQGGGAVLRLVIGIDEEPGLASSWDLVDGTRPLTAKDVLVARSSAVRLGLRVGDDVVLGLRTYQGQRNTANLRVSGIFRDDPIFGRGVVYVDRRALNQWSGRAEGYGTEATLWTDGPLDTGRITALEALWSRAGWRFWSHSSDKRAFLSRYPSETWEGEKSVLFALGDHVTDLNAALAALRAGLVLLVLLLSSAAALGLGSTLKVLLHERLREIGTLRALGMTRWRTFVLLAFEPVLLAFVAALVGSILGAGLLCWLSAVNLEGSSFVEPLLIRGTLGYRLDAAAWLTGALWAATASLAATAATLLRVTRGEPSRGLAEGF